MDQIIPLDLSPNQTFTCSLSIDDEIRTLQFGLRYNEMAGYWAMSAYDSDGNPLVTAVPLLAGENLLGQFGYLGIGSAYILNASNVAMDSPDDTNLGSDFKLAWGVTQ